MTSEPKWMVTLLVLDQLIVNEYYEYALNKEY
jgi:hypothetical protein